RALCPGSRSSRHVPTAVNLSIDSTIRNLFALTLQRLHLDSAGSESEKSKFG
ncbi:jg26032, partial [Pararge aegeria aegeria]